MVYLQRSARSPSQIMLLYIERGYFAWFTENALIFPFGPDFYVFHWLCQVQPLAVTLQSLHNLF